jgi:4-hydroxy-3-methylbut-2-enyl diphosphate reductase
LGEFINGEISLDEFEKVFKGKHSDNFDATKHLTRVGVINQTTMLATETQEIADYFKNQMIQKYGIENIQNHFADTRDTLCYATNENQEATYGLLKSDADLAIVVGGYNSSNTSHIVELCEHKLPTYFISSEKEIVSEKQIFHFDFTNQIRLSTEDYLPKKLPLDILLTSGASCPDSVIESVLRKILSYFDTAKTIEEVMNEIDF